MQINLKTEKLIVTTAFISIAAYFYFYANEVNLALEKNGGAFRIIKTQWDDWIPFIPEFIYAYYIYFPFLLLVVPITKTRVQFYHVVSAFAILESTAIATFILYPTKITRPDIEPLDFTHQLVYAIFSADPGYNLLPSLHVGHSVLVAVFFYVYQKKYFLPVCLIALSICLSTVFVKQHYVIDIPFGILYSLTSYNIAKYLIYRKTSNFAVQ